MVHFTVVPSIGVVHLVTQTRKWAPTELGSTLKSQTLYAGIFHDARKNGMVYFTVAPSIGVAHFK